MITVIADLEGLTPYQQSREYTSRMKKEGNESNREFEDRTWKNRAHTTPDGIVFIPAGAIKQCLIAGCRYLNEKIPEHGQKRWAGKFEAAVIVKADALTGVHIDDVVKRSVFGASDGRRNSRTRVWKHFPTILDWHVKVEFQVLDNIITEKVFRRQLEAAGAFVGLGTWRPENGGENGRFVVKKLEWMDCNKKAKKTA